MIINLIRKVTNLKNYSVRKFKFQITIILSLTESPAHIDMKNEIYSKYRSKTQQVFEDRWK